MPINFDRLRTGGAFCGALVQDVLPAPPTARELEVGDRVGAFRIERELSRGGMGVVYVARRDDGEFSQRVALKWMSGAQGREAAEALFRRERDILAGLEHPGIARLIDGGRAADGMLWFAMELIEGAAIDDWCEMQQAPLRKRVALVLELCAAVGFAHQRLLIHRDIKPANVLVGADGRVRLLDFGIARLADQGDLVGSAALTPGYASPEQWAGEEVTAASDIYQLGLLLAGVCGVFDRPGSAHHVTRSGAQAEMRMEPVEIDAVRLGRLPRDLAAIIGRATELRPALRYPTVEALGSDLAALLERRPVAARGDSWSYRCTCMARRHPWVAAAALVAVSAIGLLGWRMVVERDTAIAEATRARASLDFVAELLKWAKPSENHGQPVSVDAALARGVTQLAQREDLPARVQGELAHVLGGVYLQRRQRDEARPLLEQAYRQLREAGMNDRRALARTALDLGSVLGGADERERSIALLDEALQRSEREPGLEHWHLQAWRIKVLRLSQAGRSELALSELDRLIARAGTLLARDDELHLELAAMRAVLLDGLGRDNERLEILRRVHEHQLRNRGAHHPDTSHAAAALANAMIRADRFEEAGELIDADLAVRRALWSEHHAEYSGALGLRAFLGLRRGDLGAAHADVSRAIAIASSDGDRGRQFLSNHYELLGLIESARADFEASERALRSSLEVSLAGAALNPDFGRRRLTLAGVLLERGRDAEAAQELGRARPELEKLMPSHPRWRKAVEIEVTLLQRAGKREAALARIDVAASHHAAAASGREREHWLALLEELRGSFQHAAVATGSEVGRGQVR